MSGDTDSMNNKRILIVGGTAGIGRALAISCLKRGAEVWIVGRRQPDAPLSEARFLQKDLSSMKNAQSLVDDLKKLGKPFDILVFTNGIISTKERTSTDEGIEQDLAISYLSRYVMLQKIFAEKANHVLIKEGETRVFVMGYPGTNQTLKLDDLNSEQSYAQFEAHMKTVVCNEALVSYCADQKVNVLSYGLNPGLIKTEIRDNFFGKGSWLSTVFEFFIGLFFKSAEQYSERVLVPLMTSPSLKSSNKALFDSGGTVLKPNPFFAENPQAYSWIIEQSEALRVKALGSK